MSSASQSSLGVSDWITIARSESVADGEMLAVSVGKHLVAIYRVKEQLYATGNICTHGQALLTDGWLEGNVIECPLHGGRFDIRDGKGLGAPIQCDLKVYALRERAGEIQIDRMKVV